MREEIGKAKPAGNDSGFIKYSNTIFFPVIWLDNCGYLITQRKKFLSRQDSSWLKKLGRTKRLPKVENLVGI